MQTTGLKPEDIPTLMDGVLRANTAQTDRFDAYLPLPAFRTTPPISLFWPMAR